MNIWNCRAAWLTNMVTPLIVFAPAIAGAFFDDPVTLSIAILTLRLLAISLPFTELFVRTGQGNNVMFGPNAGHREGRIHAARFGYCTGNSQPLLGPVP